MNKLIFHPGDFKPILDLFDRNTYEHPENKAAEIAQSIFDEWLKGATVVYGNNKCGLWDLEKGNVDTHKALLICVKPLKPKCEKHTVVTDFQEFCFRCETCGVEMQPTGWKEKE